MKRRKLLALALVLAGLTSVTVWADDVVLDDLVVSGSSCVGTDCQDGEAFGFDTVRLKENNLRIRFQDTSGGTFPSNDWQLIANDSANGGQNYFGVEDATAGTFPLRLMAGAPDNAIHVARGGVGFGTASPQRPLHVAVGDTPGLRLEQNNSVGWPAYRWEMAANESNFFVRDATAATTPLRIFPGADDATLVVAPGGRVGIGTDTPDGSLHLAADGAVDLVHEDTAADVVWRETFGPESGGGHAWSLSADDQGATTTPIHVSQDGDVVIAGTLSQGSSRTIKRGVREVDPDQVLQAVDALEVSRWKYRSDAGGSDHMGPMAEDFHRHFGLGVDERHIAPNDLAGVAVAAAKALSSRVRDQNAEIERLRGEASALEERLSRIEALLHAR